MSGIDRIEQDEIFKEDILFLKSIGFFPLNSDVTSEVENLTYVTVNVKPKYPKELV